jgi:asparagine synthase (glutamine-hydrolysing)
VAGPQPLSSNGPFRGNAWNGDRQLACWHGAGDAGVACLGEIYNSHELCKQLDLTTSSPLPSVLLEAWRRWSLDFVTRLDGVFVLALYGKNELNLYRDPSGLLDLYYFTDRNSQFSFASNLEALLPHSSTQRRLSRRSLHEYLRFGDIAAPNTMFEGAHAVEAGQLVRWTPAGVGASLSRRAEQEPESPIDFDAAVDALDTHLQRSVQVRLGGALRPAAFLSGGVDSSIICALASRQRPDTTAITVGFDGPAHDEAPVAARIAQHLGLRHQVLRFSRDQYLAAFERLTRHLVQPIADPATPATVLAFDHCREHFDAVLDGTGADEAAGAMPPRHVRLAVGHASLLPRALRRGLVRGMRAVPGIAEYTPILDFEHPADTMIRWRGFTRPEIEALCGEPVSFADTHFYRTFARFPRGAHFERYSALLDAMPSDRLSQSSVITGMQVRYPFADVRTNHFLRQLRTDWRYLPGQPKRILRALLARYVPTQIWDLPKHGFDFPLQQFLAADDHALVRRYLESGPWLERVLLQADEVRRYARQFMAGEQKLAFRIWSLVVLGAWLENHEELR